MKLKVEGAGEGRIWRREQKVRQKGKGKRREQEPGEGRRDQETVQKSRVKVAEVRKGNRSWDKAAEAGAMS